MRFGRSTSVAIQRAWSNVFSVSYASDGQHLHRDVAVPRRLLVRGREDVARVADVVEREAEEDLRRVVRLLEELLELLVVRVPLRERLLEDRRVRRDAGDRVLLHHPLELAAVDEVAGERVEPDRLAALGDLVEP